MPLEKADLDQIQEMLSATIESLTEKFGESSEALRQEFGQQIGGVKKWAKTAIAASSTEFEKKVADAIAIESIDAPDSATGGKIEEKQGGEEVSDNKFDQLFSQIKAQSQVVDALRSDLQKSESARVQSEENARKIAAKGQFISKILDKVVDPETFVSVIESKGLVIEDQGKYLAKTGRINDDGSDEVVEAESMVDSFLSKDYSYFSKPREGTGTGSQPSGTDTKAKSFLRDDVSASDLFRQMEKGKSEDIFDELA